MAKARQSNPVYFFDRVQSLIERAPGRVRTAFQFFLLAWRGFVENRCPARAAGLSYTTLLALVPMLAVVLSVSKNFLQDTSADFVPKLMSRLLTGIAPALDVSAEAKEQAVEQIQSFIGNIHAGTLGTVGTLLLVVVAVRLLATVETAFNDIWGVRKGRSVWRKIVYYWTTVTLGPLVLFGAIYLTGRAEFSGLYGKLRFVTGSEKFFLQLLPFVVVWLGFALMYALMPNTTVRPRAAILGGIVAGTLWQLNSLLNTLYVSRVVTYGKIYGALGVVPVFLVGLYFSWLIVLFGAQVSFAAQNARAYLQRRASEYVDQRGRELIACRVMLAACASFARGEPAPNVELLSDRMDAPPLLVSALAQRLVEAGLLCETAAEPVALLPGRPPEAITVADVLDAMRTQPGNAAARSDEPVARLLNELRVAEQKSPANATFAELVASLSSSPR
jgi:membrane protein